jgi:hypothetical protein
VHVEASHGENTLDRVVVLRAAASGFCVVGAPSGSVDFPRAITASSQVVCAEGCSAAEVADARRAVASHRERAELAAEIEDACGSTTCTPSTRRALFRYRAGRYVEGD